MPALKNIVGSIDLLKLKLIMSIRSTNDDIYKIALILSYFKFDIIFM